MSKDQVVTPPTHPGTNDPSNSIYVRPGEAPAEESHAGAARPATKIDGLDGRIRPCYASDHKREAAAFLFSQGHGYHKTAWLLELPEATVREWLRSWKKGEFQTKLPVRQYRYTEERKQEIIAMRKRGMSWNEIYKLTGISAATIRKWMPKDSLITTGNASHRGES